MNYTLTLLILLSSVILVGQDTFYGSYSDHTYKVDDYIYIGEDSLVISSTEAYPLEKIKIKIGEFSFTVDDGGMGFKSKKVNSKPSNIDSINMYAITGPYGANWNVLKANIKEESVIGVFHAAQEMQPVLNLTVYATHKITNEELSNFILSYLAIERENIKDYHLTEVDKYEIGDIPKVKSFVSRVMKKASGR